MWKSIAFVSSGLTLVAFIIAAAVWIYRKWLLQKERLIRQAPEGERAKLVENALEFFNVNTAGLRKEQQYRIAIRQIHDRTVRFRITAFVVVIIAFLATGISIFALLHENSGGGQRTPTPTSTPILAPTPTTTLTPHPTPALTPTPVASTSTAIPKPSVPFPTLNDESVTEGVLRNNMQACPPGYAIGGAWLRRTSPSTFLCRRVISRGEERYEVTVEDNATQRNGIHACPPGMYMIGVHLGNGVWLCGYDSRRGIRQTEEFLDGPPVNSPSLDKGMHACPSTPGRIGYLAGIYEMDNRFLCAEYHP